MQPRSALSNGSEDILVFIARNPELASAFLTALRSTDQQMLSVSDSVDPELLLQLTHEWAMFNGSGAELEGSGEISRTSSGSEEFAFAPQQLVRRDSAAVITRKEEETLLRARHGAAGVAKFADEQEGGVQ